MSLNYLLLDTNVYILGASEPQSYEAKILQWLGFEDTPQTTAEVILSDELVEQISRVAKRLKNKDWSGELLSRIWQKLNILYVNIHDIDINNLPEIETIPREDVGIYLTAIVGKIDIFISANHELIRVLANKTGYFESLTPKQFFIKYLT